ncbi:MULTISPECIES: cyclase family protein [unclassified Rhodococcus (in: high G+C Gram-positive bacteria)]|uniref:cyclase family protein n=1 Tax=Rhodococcus sp. SJ-3 TaxID=3454628 RepID=UPI003F7ACDBB
MPPLLPSAEILVKALRDRMINVIDLTAPLSDSTPVLPLPEGMEPIPHFALEELARYDERGETSYQNGIRTGEHVGTHFDAPCHWITGRDLADVASVPPEELISPFVVIDKSQEAADNPDFLLEIEHVQKWEQRHGALPTGGWLLYRSGWDRRSTDQQQFINADERGPHTPGVSVECAKWLAGEAPIRGLGVETVGIDAGQAFAFDPPFPCHHYLLGAGKYGVTQLQNLESLPTVGGVLVVAPLKIVGGSGSPARVLAIVDAPA